MVERGIAPAPGALSAATRAAGSLAGPAKTLNSVSATRSPTSTSSRELRRSGRSVPKRAIALFASHAGKGIRQRDAEHAVEDVAHQRFHEPGDGAGVEEGGLDIELGELRLAVRAQVLVAEAANDLVVALEARHHQELLEDLGRLRQCEEVGPGWVRLGTR